MPSPPPNNLPEITFPCEPSLSPPWNVTGIGLNTPKNPQSPQKKGQPPPTLSTPQKDGAPKTPPSPFKNNRPPPLPPGTGLFFGDNQQIIIPYRASSPAVRKTRRFRNPLRGRHYQKIFPPPVTKPTLPHSSEWRAGTTRPPPKPKQGENDKKNPLANIAAAPLPLGGRHIPPGDPPPSASPPTTAHGPSTSIPSTSTSATYNTPSYKTPLLRQYPRHTLLHTPLLHLHPPTLLHRILL